MVAFPPHGQKIAYRSSGQSLISELELFNGNGLHLSKSKTGSAAGGIGDAARPLRRQGMQIID
jgi:hypothetical protein